jgi:PST family polysaccharide transporter
MSRDFMQRQRFVTDAAFLVSSTVTMLVLVNLGHPVMGLALSRVFGQLVSVVLLNVMAPEHYWFGFSGSEARALLSFGLPLAGANLVTLAIANVDFMVVGHVLGAKQLGYYNLAFNISGWPVSIFSAVLISVTLPTLSRVRNQPAELAKHLEAGLSAVVAASFPVSALLTALAIPLIDTVYGVRWQHAWTALIVLSIFGAARTVLTLFSDLLIALGLTRRLLAIQLVWLLLLTPAMIIGVHELKIGGAGVAHASVVVLAVIPLYLMTVAGRTDVPLNWVRRSIVVPLLASVASALAAYGVTRAVSGHGVQLLLGIAVGAVVYCVLAAPWLRRVIRTLREMYWLPTSDEEPGESPEADRILQRSTEQVLGESGA